VSGKYIRELEEAALQNFKGVARVSRSDERLGKRKNKKAQPHWLLGL
jgi:hypothetical protein